MCFNKNQRGDISIVNGGYLKLIDKFSNLGSGVSSAKNDINTLLAKFWKVTHRSSVIWKSDLSNKIGRIFFQAAVRCVLYMDAPHRG